MPKPITPLCGYDVFITDSEERVLLICRTDNGQWALPGGCQNLDDTPREAAVRECLEETGLEVKISHLLGVWSSLCYEYVNYPWKDNTFTHLLFRAEVIGGIQRTSGESSKIGWFAETELPLLSDGHAPRISFGFRWLKDPGLAPYFE